MSTAKAIISRLGDKYECELLVVDDKTPFQYPYEMMSRHTLLRIIQNLYTTFSARFLNTLPSLYFPGLKPSLLKAVESVTPGQDVICISVTPWINRFVGNTLKKYAPRAKFLVMPTDLHDLLLKVGDPFNTYWLDGQPPEVLYLLGSEELVNQAKQVGIMNFRQLSGVVLKEEFTALNKSKKEIREILGIPLDKKVVLFLFGSCASSEMVYLMRLLQDSEYHCIFICGKATKIQRQLEELNVNKRHRVLGFVSNVEEWMKASDVCIGKPGVIVTTECVASKIPIVVRNGLDVMILEKYNIEYIREHKLGVVVDRWKSLPEKLSELFSDYAAYQEALEAFPENHAIEEIFNIIESLSLTEPVDITELILGY
jgi:hypothetical protein